MNVNTRLRRMSTCQVPTPFLHPTFVTPNYDNPNSTIQALRFFLPSRSRFCLAPDKVFKDTARKCRRLAEAVGHIKSEVYVTPG